ncbi:MAG: Unknown protein [uncultured Campylobacterales bacterium]|uniref:DUF6701 domain-containing protein n=1 Tax=uncultured Campylobacterales bacterium TaxID=352960 RepID=A0A6S6TA22_9BACT|nr:MAG: Unknown protein [uncultured Campylobacterales bacterium]
MHKIFFSLTLLFSFCTASFNATDINNSVIQTKYVSKSFDLEVTSNIADFNGTVCVAVVDSNDINISSWQSKDMTNGDSFVKSFNVDQAVRIARIKIKYNQNIPHLISDCSLPLSLSETYYGDSFSVRPEKFVFDELNATYISQEELSLVLGVYNVDDNLSLNYEGTDLRIEIAKKFSDGSDDDGSLEGNMSFDIGAFVSGKSDINLSFDDIGIVDFKIIDTNWTAVDIGDGTSSSDLEISTEFNTTFLLDKFKITFGNMKIEDYNSTYTYFSDDLNMSSKVSEFNITISAVGEKNITTANYTSSVADKYYDQNISYEIKIDLNTTDIYSETLFTKSNFDANFTNGVATLNVKDILFNYGRDMRFPKNPKKVFGRDHNISFYVIDSDAIEANITSILDGNATFFYGRIHRSDIFSENNVENNVEIFYEVYCDENNCSQYDLNTSNTSANWYINRLHNDTSSGKVSSYRSVMETKIQGLDIYSSLSISSGIETIRLQNLINKLPIRDRIELNASSWMRYNPYIVTDIMDFYISFGGEKTEFDSKESNGATWLGSGEQGKVLDLLMDKSPHDRLE